MKLRHILHSSVAAIGIALLLTAPVHSAPAQDAAATPAIVVSTVIKNATEPTEPNGVANRLAIGTSPSPAILKASRSATVFGISSAASLRPKARSTGP